MLRPEWVGLTAGIVIGVAIGAAFGLPDVGAVAGGVFGLLVGSAWDLPWLAQRRYLFWATAIPMGLLTAISLVLSFVITDAWTQAVLIGAAGTWIGVLVTVFYVEVILETHVTRREQEREWRRWALVRMFAINDVEATACGAIGELAAANPDIKRRLEDAYVNYTISHFVDYTKTQNNNIVTSVMEQISSGSIYELKSLRSRLSLISDQYRDIYLHYPSIIDHRISITIRTAHKSITTIIYYLDSLLISMEYGSADPNPEQMFGIRSSVILVIQDNLKILDDTKNIKSM